MRSHAAVADGRGGYAIDTVDVDEPGPGEVLVKIEASGVCHTDADGVSRWCTSPTVLGHEGAGTVLRAGPGVQELGEGSRVLLTWTIACGRCFQCTLGEPTLCEVLGRPHGAVTGGITHDLAGGPVDRYFNLGTLSTHTVVRSEAAVPLPASVPFSSACLLGCAVMTGYGSVVNAARVRTGATVAVIGCGGVGLNVIQAARIAGATRIIAIDVQPKRFPRATQFGATDVLRADPADIAMAELVPQIHELCGGRGSDYAFECTGIPALGAAPLACVRDGGTAIQVSGIEEHVDIDMTLFEWDKTYLNPLYGKCRPSIDFPTLFRLYEQKLLLLDEQVSQTYALADLPQAFADMRSGDVAKAVVLP